MASQDPGLGTGRASKKDWRLSEAAFRRLLEWLDEGTDSHGATYLEIRRRLACHFDRKNCPSADELADETLNRVARRLEEEGNIVSAAPARYCYIVAKYVLLENLHTSRRGPISLETLSDSGRSRVLSSAKDQEAEWKKADDEKRL